MLFKLVTCPETAHLELITYDDDPLGMLIEGCSRFEPTCALSCPRTCAARLDRRARRGDALDAIYEVLDIGDATSVGLDLTALGLQVEQPMHDP